jgi:hypothetical protein
LPHSRHRLPLGRRFAPLLLSLLLAQTPVQAQIVLPPIGDPPPPEDPEPEPQDDGDDDRKGPFDSLDSGSWDGSDESGDSIDSDGGDEALVITAFASLVVAGVYLSIAESRDDGGGTPVARARTVEDLLGESAATQAPLQVVSLRPADSRESRLSPDQRRSAMVVTASTPSGEQIALTVNRDVARLTADDTLFVRRLDQGYQVTAGGELVSFVPESRLLELTGHAPLRTAP